MKLRDLVLNRLIVNRGMDGTLFFIPRKIEERTIFGYSIYIPNEETPVRSGNSTDFILEEGDTIYLGSVDKIYEEGLLSGRTDTVKLSSFRNAEDKDIEHLFRKLAELKIVLSEDAPYY